MKLERPVLPDAAIYCIYSPPGVVAGENAPQNGEFTVDYPSHVSGPESMLKEEVSADDKGLCGLMLSPANSVTTDIYIQVIAIFSPTFLSFRPGSV